jgi:hypothetical protein
MVIRIKKKATVRSFFRNFVSGGLSINHDKNFEFCKRPLSSLAFCTSEFTKSIDL